MPPSIVRHLPPSTDPPLSDDRSILRHRRLLFAAIHHLPQSVYHRAASLISCRAPVLHRRRAPPSADVAVHLCMQQSSAEVCHIHVPSSHCRRCPLPSAWRRKFRVDDAGRRKKKLRVTKLSKLYSFGCGRASFKEKDISQLGGPGFSRVVFANEPDCFEAGIRDYVDNYVSTAKYSLATFLPKSLFEQFRRVANFYFLVTGILSFTPLAPFNTASNIIPLIIVIAATMVKEGIEDWRRKQQDIEVNNRMVKVHQGEGVFIQTEWKNLRVGDIVKVEKDEFFPADLIMLSSSYEDGVCYVETTNLDGETNLKLRQGLETILLVLNDDSDFESFKSTIKCEDPNANLYTFVGSLEHGDEQYPLGPQQLLLRDSKLRNTEYIYGAVVFTGHDTKVMQNATSPPSKRSRIEKKMDRIIYFLFCVVFLMGLVGSIYFGISTKDDLKGGRMKRWYLRPDDSVVFFDSKRAVTAAMFHFLTAIMLYGYFIPISLYVSIEIVKVLQCIFINQDVHMYYDETDKPAHARTSNLNEELGQVDTILSDKTGTLTCNSMEFIKFSVAGTAYGHGITEVERAMERRISSSSIINSTEGGNKDFTNNNTIKGFNFKDKRISNGQWVHEANAGTIQRFMRLLALCHTAIPDVDEDHGTINYEAESPDEAAFVIAAREFGFEFYKRTQTSISVRELDMQLQKKVEREYTLLNILEFNSTRKRMSVIVKDEEGKIQLLSKGADSVMFERLAQGGREFEGDTRKHVNQYADAGLRTLILAYHRETLIEKVAEDVEKDLILLGATAVEDKLQNGVPDCIDKLAQAGIKIWVLTGDKMETAINIGFACSLLRQGMKQIIINLEFPELQSLEISGDKAAINKVSKEHVLRQINEGKELTASSGGSSNAFALIIDGKSLTYALANDVKKLFLDLSMSCASVICCRSSPKQKALVTRLVKNGTGKTTLAIGDGANDVGMLQEADIGVGISGVEGMQICYFFYKNVTFGISVFLYEAFASFSGQSVYNDWFLSLYNVFFTSLPVIALGIFDQDVSSRCALKFPLLYQEGAQNVLFSWRRIITWMVNGVYSAIMIFFFCTKAMENQAFNKDGMTTGRDILGATMYTCIVWAVNLQMALSINYFTVIQHILIWGSVAFWYIFLMIYGSMSPGFAGNAYMIFVEVLAPTPSFWIITLFAVISTLIPYFCFSAMQMRFFPMYHQMVQWMRHEGQSEDPQFCDMVRQRSIRPTTVGFTARVAAKSSRSNSREENPLQVY
ncbi:Putative phospholipid-transporting ATPase 9 [Linum grandiflorum]